MSTWQVHVDVLLIITRFSMTDDEWQLFFVRDSSRERREQWIGIAKNEKKHKIETKIFLWLRVYVDRVRETVRRRKRMYKHRNRDETSFMPWNDSLCKCEYDAFQNPSSSPNVDNVLVIINVRYFCTRCFSRKTNEIYLIENVGRYGSMVIFLVYGCDRTNCSDRGHSIESSAYRN